MVAAQPARRVPPTWVLYLAVVIVFWSASLYFAGIRGESMCSRYLVLGIVLLLPDDVASASDPSSGDRVNRRSDVAHRHARLLRTYRAVRHASVDHG